MAGLVMVPRETGSGQGLGGSQKRMNGNFILETWLPAIMCQTYGKLDLRAISAGPVTPLLQLTARKLRHALAES